MGQDARALFGQRVALRAFGKEARAKVMFQPGDPAPDCRRVKPQRFARAGKALGASDGKKQLQIIPVHAGHAKMQNDFGILPLFLAKLQGYCPASQFGRIP